MPETEWTEEDVRREVAVVWEQFLIDPSSVSPGYAGALAHAAVLGYEDTEPDDHELDVLMQLLLHGSTHAYDPMISAWRLSLAKCHSAVAERKKSLEHWQRAVDWGMFAADHPPADEEEALEDLLDVIDLHAGRVWAIRDAWRDEGLTADRAIDEIGDAPDVIGQLADRLTHPIARAIADVRRARVLGMRWMIGEDVADLNHAVRLLTDQVFLIPDGYFLQVEDLTAFGDLCLMQDKHAPSLVPVNAAVAAVEKAIALTPPDAPELPEHHSLAALLLGINDDPGHRDRIIHHLAGAAEADDPHAWAWYASALQERGGEHNYVSDLLNAADWYRRAAEHPDAERVWDTWAQFVETHYQLHDLGQGPRHADIVIDCATELLRNPPPDADAVAYLHRYRLICAFQGGKRPGLAGFLRDHPFVQWLTDAEEIVDSAEEPWLLAAIVGLSWMWAIGESPELAAPHAGDLLAALARAERMFALAQRHPDPTAEYVMGTKVLSQLITNQLRATTGDREADFSAFQEFLADPAYTDVHSELTDVMAMTSAQVGLLSKALGPLQAGHRLFSRQIDQPRPEDSQRELEVTQLFFQLVEHFHLHGAENLLDLSTRAFELASTLPPTPSNAPMQAMCESIHRMIATAHSVPLGPRRFQSGNGFLSGVLRPLQLGEDITAALKNGDGDRLREICAELEDMELRPDFRGLDLNPCRHVRAVALEAIVKVEPWNREALREAIEAYVERVELLDKKYHPLMDTSVMTLGSLLRHRNEPGDRQRSHDLGYDALWHATWYVLQQSSTEHALEFARTATTNADELTAWCLTDGATDDLVRIVDARRGLVLKAATTGHTLVDQLSDAGQAELAEKWADTAGKDAPLLPGWDASTDNFGGLRRTVMRTLADESDDLITPPSVEEIQAALRTHGSDALIYLLPANQHHTGQAVVVPVRGDAFTSPLAFLKVDDAPQRYRDAYDAWSDAETATGPECDRWRDELHRLCDWAWGAAGGELLRLLGRDSRVVLVPVGALGIVPWHAAVRTDKGLPRYLVQDMAISYAPSARLFCDVLKRAEVVTGKPVLVGNPARDLPAGAAEAVAVRDVFHPDGLFLGGFSRAPRPWKPSPDGSGTPAQVLAALRNPVPLLHLACHAVADMRQPLRSHVKLATAHLSALELLELSPVDVVPLGTVNLAGCTTNVSGVDYDEALSLATTFLAIGARTVIGSLWRVPAGRSTAHLMFMFYHYLRDERPADALRRAQQWMLDGDREFPDSMPESLRRLPPSADFDPADVASWAGFTHLGR